MSLRTQVSPYTLIGHIADLPNPASVAQGMLFHADDTGECRILVINPATGVRSWDEFCGISGITGVQGPALLKWAGGADVGARPIFFIADTPDATSVAPAGPTPAYPLARARTALNFDINVRSNTGGVNLTVDLLVNGVVALTHSFAFPGPTTGIFNVAGPASIPPSAIIDVRVTSTSTFSSGTVLVSATLELF